MLLLRTKLVHFFPVENKGHDWEWGSEAPKDCGECKSAEGCKEKVCVAADGFAQTFPSVCEAMKIHAGKKDLITLYWALGDCKEHFDANGKIYT